MDCSPTGSSVHGTSQARILEWVAIYFSRGSPWPRDRTCISYIGRPILYHWATWEAQKVSLEDVEKKILSGFWGHNSLWYKNTFQFNHRDRWQKKSHSLHSSLYPYHLTYDLLWPMRCWQKWCTGLKWTRKLKFLSLYASAITMRLCPS